MRFDKMFDDRTDAGIQLSEKLQHYRDEDVVVLAVPRGGLPVAALVAKSLNAPLDVALIKKLGHPFNREYAIGAVSLNNVVINDDTGISKSYIQSETKRIREVLQQRHDQYYKNRSSQNLTGKVVIIIDDGIATGSTVLATIQLIATQSPSKIVVAIPVAPGMSVARLKDAPEVDEVICVSTPLNFHAVGQFYRKFGQVSDDEAISIFESLLR